MNSNRERWLQLALVAVCAALEEVECTDEALTEALFVGMPGVKIDDLTAAAVAEALRRSSHVTEAAALLDRSRGFIYDSLRRRRREWAGADWVAYGAELRRRRLLAGWSVAELSRRINLSGMTIHNIEQARGQCRPTDLMLAKLAAGASGYDMVVPTAYAMDILIKQGKTDAEIKEFMVSRYGDFVLYRPPVKPTTWLLWAGPFGLMAAGLAGLFVYLRRRNTEIDGTTTGLTEDERKRAEALLQEGDK